MVSTVSVSGIAGSLILAAVAYRSHRRTKDAILEHVSNHIKVSDISSSDFFSASVEDMVRIAQDITCHCFTRWDSFWGIRPHSSVGIWRAKFDGVRGATMLLAFHHLNATISKLDAGELAESHITFVASRVLLIHCVLAQGLP